MHVWLKSGSISICGSLKLSLLLGLLQWPSAAQSQILDYADILEEQDMLILAKGPIRPTFNRVSGARPAAKPRSAPKIAKPRVRKSFNRASGTGLKRSFARAARPSLKHNFARASNRGSLQSRFSRAAHAPKATQKRTPIVSRNTLKRQFANAKMRGVMKSHFAKAKLPAVRKQFGKASAKSFNQQFRSAVGQPHATGKIRSFRTSKDMTFYRVYSPNGPKSHLGSFLTKHPPKNSAWAQKYLALPHGNKATHIQKVTVPKNTWMTGSHTKAAFGKPGGAQQFRLQHHIPDSSYGVGKPLRGGLSGTFKSKADPFTPFG